MSDRKEVKPGQWWKDIVNKDIYRVLRVSHNDDADRGPEVAYVSLACYSNGAIFGLQEQRVSTLLDTMEFPEQYTPGRKRYQRLGWLASLWYSFKHRGSLNVPKSGPGAGVAGLGQKSTY